MKIREDFVTNSSSSSFICKICGNVEGGYDASLSDVGYVECENGHIFCEHHIDEDYIDSKENLMLMLKCLEKYLTEKIAAKSKYVKQSELDKVKKIIVDFEEDENSKLEEVKEILYENDYYRIHNSKCPICTLQEINDKELLDYICIENNINKKSVAGEIRKKFKHINEFEKYIRG